MITESEFKEILILLFTFRKETLNYFSPSLKKKKKVFPIMETPKDSARDENLTFNFGVIFFIACSLPYS